MSASYKGCVRTGIAWTRLAATGVPVKQDTCRILHSPPAFVSNWNWEIRCFSFLFITLYFPYFLCTENCCKRTDTLFCLIMTSVCILMTSLITSMYVCLICMYICMHLFFMLLKARWSTHTISASQQSPANPFPFCPGPLLSRDWHFFQM